MLNLRISTFLLLLFILCLACGGNDDSTTSFSDDSEDPEAEDDDDTSDENTSDDDASDDDDDNDTVPDDDDSGDDDDSTDEMVLVPAGQFKMGCEPDDGECDTNETPRHDVTLSAYFIDIHEVTNEQYATYMNNTNPSNDCSGDTCVYSMHIADYKGLYESGGEWLVDDGWEDRPVVYVTWYGAVGYCATKGKRLPTEAQWEKAAKGDAEHYIYPWGDSWVKNSANDDGNDPYSQGPEPHTTPVGFFDGSSYKYQTVDGRSPYGAHDMAGNVWEWTADWYDPLYYETSQENEPQGPATGSQKVTRGGSWGNKKGDLRTSNRFSWNPSFFDHHLGFRCAK